MLWSSSSTSLPKSSLPQTNLALSMGCLSQTSATSRWYRRSASRVVTRGPAFPEGLSRVSTLKMIPSLVGVERMVMICCATLAKNSRDDTTLGPSVSSPAESLINMISRSDEYLSSCPPSLPRAMTAKRGFGGVPNLPVMTSHASSYAFVKETSARVESCSDTVTGSMVPERSLIPIRMTSPLQKRLIISRDSS